MGEFKIDQTLLFFAISIPLSIFYFTAITNFAIFYCLHNWTCNISAAKWAREL